MNQLRIFPSPRRGVRGEAFLLLLLLIFPPLLGEGSGVRLLAEAGKSQIPLADPYILLDAGTYYAYGTHDASGIRCYSSTDLRAWKDEGQALNKANTSETQNFWAPEVYRIGSKYIMYYSANEHLFAATASSPTGPFRQEGGYQMEPLIGSEKCIDSHVFIDEDSTAYIFFVRFTDGNCIWQARLADDFITPVDGTLRKCFAVSQDWENKMGRVNEGPNVIKNGRLYYLTYSGNDYRSQDYAVGYATTTNLATANWTKYTGNPILRRHDDLVGTGHHSLFRDKEGILRIVFHAHYSTEEVGPRLMYIGTVQFRGSNLEMTGDPLIRPTLTSLPYNPELITQSWGMENASVVSVDLNNDGWQDIVAAGYARDTSPHKRMSRIALFTASTHKWRTLNTTPPFRVGGSPSLVPCDINGDGNMDLVAFGPADNEADDDVRQGIFLGKGNGTFTEAQLVLLPTGQAIPSGTASGAAADVIDANNDGRLDILLVGELEGEPYNVILLNQSADNGTLCFQAEPFDTEFHLCDAIIQTADLNNDGLQDFAISARVVGQTDQLRFTDVYLNNPDDAGHFVRLGLGEKGANLKRKSNGVLCVADFNDDGWLDILLAGLGESSSGETATRQRIYLNQQTDRPSFKAASGEFQTDIYTQSATSLGAAGVIDWDGDGSSDVLLGGIKSKACSGTLYLNDGKGRLSRHATIPGATGASIAFPDYNGDGRRDFLLLGYSTDNNYLIAEQQGSNAILCYNLFPTPSRPDAPLAPTWEKHDGSIKLTWQAPPSAKAGFTYDLYIRNEAGQLLAGTCSVVGGKNDGLRKTNRLGNAGCRTEWTFRPEGTGTYEWGVQTVDAAYGGSPFAQGMPFVVTEEDIATTTGKLPDSNMDTNMTYNLAGQHQPEMRRGISITKGRKLLIQ